MSFWDLCALFYRDYFDLNVEWYFQDNPFERILAKDLLNWFNHSKMVAFFHTNPMSAEDHFKVSRNYWNFFTFVAVFINAKYSDSLWQPRVLTVNMLYFQANIALKKQNMTLKNYGHKTARLALENTEYEAVLSLFQSHNSMVFSSETQVSKLLRLLKKMPQLILMGKWCVFDIKITVL